MRFEVFVHSLSVNEDMKLTEIRHMAQVPLNYLQSTKLIKDCILMFIECEAL
jgi:hypothetical protein